MCVPGFHQVLPTRKSRCGSVNSTCHRVCATARVPPPPHLRHTQACIWSIHLCLSGFPITCRSVVQYRTPVLAHWTALHTATETCLTHHLRVRNHCSNAHVLHTANSTNEASRDVALIADLLNKAGDVRQDLALLSMAFVRQLNRLTLSMDYEILWVECCQSSETPCAIRVFATHKSSGRLSGVGRRFLEFSSSLQHETRPVKLTCMMKHYCCQHPVALNHVH